MDTSQTCPTDTAYSSIQVHGVQMHVIPKAIQDAAERGDFVHLEQFVPSDVYVPHGTVFADSDIFGQVQWHTKQAHHIESFDDWLTAWNIFERVLMNKKPNLYNDLATYREIIQHAHHKYKWNSVYMYDKKFRAKLARTQSFKYASLDHDLYTCTLTQAAIRNDKRCLRCKSVYHKVAKCPFPQRPAQGQAQVSSRVSRITASNITAASSPSPPCRMGDVPKHSSSTSFPISSTSAPVSGLIQTRGTSHICQCSINHSAMSASDNSSVEKYNISRQQGELHIHSINISTTTNQFLHSSPTSNWATIQQTSPWSI